MELHSPEDVRGKKVLIMGLGLHGGGSAAARWFYQHGARVCVTDLKKPEELQKSIERLEDSCRIYALTHSDQELFSIEYVLGVHREEDFLKSDLLIQNPAVPPSSPYLKIAKEHGGRIENELSFFFLCTPRVQKICVTGTRGKSTTTLLIFEMLRRTFPKTSVAGVALGEGTIPFFDILDTVCSYEQVGEHAPVVLECSSFQLEFLNQATGGPARSVLTNIYTDHLNRYESLNAYIEAKKNIFRFANSENILIANYDNPITRQIGKGHIPGKRYWFSRTDQSIDGVFLGKNELGEEWFYFRNKDKVTSLCSRTTLSLLGDHSVENACAALAAGVSLGINTSLLCESLSEFKGVSYRQQYIATIMGRLCINDTTATSPDGACAALKTFGSPLKKNIILLAGGSDKGLEFRQFADIIKKYTKAVILFSGTATPLLAQALKNNSYEGAFYFANGMNEAVHKAWGESAEGDILLLSPGAASFGMFAHEFDRGDQFNQAIKKLSESAMQ